MSIDVERGERVPSGVTSDPSVSSTSRDLVRALHDRKATYDLIARLDQLARKAVA